MRTYEATVRPGGKIDGKSIRINIDAPGYFDAKQLLEATYGQGNVYNIREIKLG